MAKDEQWDIPIQPVSRPILCSPYVEPTTHWVYDTETGTAKIAHAGSSFVSGKQRDVFVVLGWF
jgi:hypothetical protein